MMLQSLECLIFKKNHTKGFGSGAFNKQDFYSNNIGSRFFWYQSTSIDGMYSRWASRFNTFMTKHYNETFFNPTPH